MLIQKYARINQYSKILIAPVFLPAIGLALSPLSTLPIAIAAVSNISLGFTVFFSRFHLFTRASGIFPLENS